MDTALPMIKAETHTENLPICIEARQVWFDPIVDQCRKVFKISGIFPDRVVSLTFS